MKANIEVEGGCKDCLAHFLRRAADAIEAGEVVGESECDIRGGGYGFTVEQEPAAWCAPLTGGPAH